MVKRTRKNKHKRNRTYRAGTGDIEMNRLIEDRLR